MNQLFKFILAMQLFAGMGVYAQCPENIGFENGGFKNWEAYVGDILPNGDIDVYTSSPVSDRHAIMSASAMTTDSYGDFPTVSPNGSGYAVRLGNDATNHQAERLSYTFTVPAGQQYSLVLNYAVVLQNPAHPNYEQPRFTVTVFNITDNQAVECPAFDFIASTSLPGFKVSTVNVGGQVPADVYYKDWTATTIDLSAYSGKQIRLEFTTNDCGRMGHFGYAYFDLNENCQQPITGNIICDDQASAKLQGPKGFTDYKWFNAADMTTVLGNKQSLTLTPAPPVGAKYVLRVGAIEGLGCPGDFATVITRAGEPFVFKVKQKMFFCRGTIFNLTAPEVTAGSGGGLLPFEYYTDDVTQEYLRNPDKITEPGIYYIRAANAAGCTDILPVELAYYNDIDFTLSQPKAVHYPETVDISTTYTRNPTYQYFYYKDAGHTTPLDEYQYKSIGVSGTYYIKAQTSDGCEKKLSVSVVIKPPAPNIISGPTVFTPNNDGANDRFNITIKGFVDFSTLKIFDRNGQFLFQTNSQNSGWDGTFNGRSLPTGTYYWLFEGTDQYYHTKINKGGSVSIIK